MPTDRPHAPPTSALPAHIPALDGLRAIAILAVFAYHTVRTPHAEGLVAKAMLHVGAGGWMGVDLFFVLSGFLITGILLDTRGSAGYFRVFALRRALRIFPLYYATLLALLAGSAMLSGAAASEGTALQEAQGWYWTHLVNLLVARDGFPGAPLHTGHFWSLAVEEQFYLVWPFVVTACSPARLRRVCLAMIGVALAARIGIVWYAGTSPVPGAYVLPFARLDTLALGAWLAVAARQPGGLDAVWPRIRQLGAVGLAGIAAIAVATRTLQWGTAPMQTVGYLAVGLVAAATLVLVVRSTGPALRILTARPLAHVGRRSYALYVLHYPLIPLAGYAGISGESISALVGSQVAGLLLWTVALFAVSLALAELSWVAIERPCLALKDRVAGRPSRNDASPASVEAAAGQIRPAA